MLNNLKCIMNVRTDASLQAFGGLVVGLVTKYAGGVVKGFALIAGIIITGIAQFVLENKPLGSKHM